MKVQVIRLIAFLLLAGSAVVVQAQDKVEGSLKVDFVTSYIWRGLQLGHVSVQPELGVSWKGFTLSANGSVGLSNRDDANEIDLTLSYATKGLTVGVVDYWTDEDDKRYFYYKKEHTGHAIEAFAGYDFGFASLSWQTIFAGNDLRSSDGRQAFSSYFEVGVPFRLATCDWQATAGLVPWASDYYETSGFRLTNLSLRATKDIKVSSSFSIPLFGELVANPCSQHLYFVAGFTLSPFQ